MLIYNFIVYREIDLLLFILGPKGLHAPWIQRAFTSPHFKNYYYALENFKITH